MARVHTRWFAPLNHATGFARNSTESLYPHLWHKHLGTLAPCVFGRQGFLMRMVGERLGDDNTNPTNVLTEPTWFGPAITNLGTENAFQAIRLLTAGGVSNPFKITPPFTLSCMMRIPEAAFAKHYRVLFCTDLRQTALQKYAGIVIYADDLSSTNLLVAQYDNAGTILDQVTRDATGPTLVQSDGSRTVNVTNWQHVVIRLSPIVQGADIDSDPENHVRFWIDGLAVSSIQANTGQALVHNALQHAAIGYIRGDGTYTPDTIDIGLWQLWTRKLSVGEINQICADPLAMLRPVRTRLGLSVVAGGRFVSLGGYYKSDTRQVLVG